jgi:hypothetical protein
MPFLKNLVNGNQSLERPEFICGNKLPVETFQCHLVQSRKTYSIVQESAVAYARCQGRRQARNNSFIPAQNDWEELWSHVYAQYSRTGLRLGAVLDILIALRIWIASSLLDLDEEPRQLTTKEERIFESAYVL